MTHFVIDIESDGPYVPQYSMVSFGAVVLAPALKDTFYAQMHPISDRFETTALSACNLTREETLLFPPAEVVMPLFVTWVLTHNQTGTRPIFMSDNTGYDFGFMNYYLWHYTDGNPFGHTSKNISDLHKGMMLNMRSSFKSLRNTSHTHHPVDDALGNAEAVLAMQAMGLRL